MLFAVWRWARSAAIILAALAISTTLLFQLPAVKCRQTNVDLVAATLSSEVAPNDYVIVHPFYCGVTFKRYYKGAAPWTTLPPLEDYTLQRWDLLKAKMQTKDPVAPIIDRITSTLQSGNRVWLVGNIPFDQRPLQEIRPAPNDPWGGSEGRYSFYWGAQVTQFLSAHCRQQAVVMAPSTMTAVDYSGPLHGTQQPLNNCVNQFENLPVFVMTEWKP